MYQVVYTGRLLKGADRGTVETELQRLFRATPRQVEWFLRGKPIVVKSSDDAALAERYHEALTKAGLECELRSDQPRSAQMAPPDEPATPQQQLPIPGVAAPPPKPAAAPRAPVQRRTPTLGPVTQAITAQDRAPPFHIPPVPAIANLPTAVPPSRQLRAGFGLLFLLVGAVLVGMLASVVWQEWRARAVAPPAHVARADTPAPAPVVQEAKPQPPEALIVGRWQCVEAGSGRVVENEFTADGRYRSLAHGRPDAFQQIDQMDVLVEGRYRLEGSTVVLHVQNIPSRQAFGRSARADDYLYWRIDTLTRDAMAWADMQLDEVRESCLRSQALPPPPG